MDERVAITKESLRIALFQQMQELGFQKISVRSLTARAGVNRTTFYLHYTDKYDLLDQVVAELIGHIRTIIISGLDRASSFLTTKKEITDAIIRVLTFIQQRKFEFEVLLGPQGDSGFIMKYGEMISEVFSTHRIPLTLPIPTEYLTAVVSSAHIGIVRAWIMRDMRESPEEMAQVISGFIQGVFRELAKSQYKLGLLKQDSASGDG